MSVYRCEHQLIIKKYTYLAMTIYIFLIIVIFMMYWIALSNSWIFTASYAGHADHISQYPRTQYSLVCSRSSLFEALLDCKRAYITGGDGVWWRSVVTECGDGVWWRSVVTECGGGECVMQYSWHTTSRYCCRDWLSKSPLGLRRPVLWQWRGASACEEQSFNGNAVAELVLQSW